MEIHIYFYFVRQKKINRLSHDCHGSVGSPSLNIAVVKETNLNSLLTVVKYSADGAAD
jgi:hypothetical protein